jgi:transcription initiation factor TFIID subunit 6
VALVTRFSQPQLSLSTRVSSVCIAALLDTRKALTSHYGAICGLAAMGPRATRLLLLPRLHEYYRRLVPVLRQV